MISSKALRKHLIAIGVLLVGSALFVPNADAQTVSSLTCSPSTITGGSGGSSTCTVTLSLPAPTGGTVTTLTSSLLELAASVPRITVPAGQTTASFTVGTNRNYRSYSLLAFNPIISATANGSTRSVTLNVTAQPRPPDFSSGSQAGSNTQWSGLMCGGIAPIGGRTEILYDCSPASGTGFGTCTFRQECSLGCKRVPPSGGTFHDSCATSGPNAVSLSTNFIVSGDRVPAAIVAEAPAGAAQDQEQGVPGVIDPDFNAIYFPQQGGIGFPTGASSVPFDVATSYVPKIEFADVKGFWFNASIPPFLITNGRGGHQWLVMLPPDPAPAVAIPTLGNFHITGTNPVRGGERTFGQIDISGLSRQGGPTITLTSSHPNIVPNTSIVTPASEQFFGYQVFLNTQAPAADTNVTITASDGRYSFSSVLRVLKPPAAPVLSGVSVNPSSVVGGNPSTGTVTLSAPQSGSTVISLSTPAPTTVATMPSSVTVPAGATSASFAIVTKPVSSQFNMNIFADLAGSPGQSALLIITAGGSTAPTLSALSVSPASVVGGNSSAGTVTLTAAAPSGGAVVPLSDNSSATAVPGSVTVPAGATSASFTVTTTSVTAATTSTISASFGGVTRTAALTVNPSTTPAPAALSAVSVNPTSVAGGSSSQGRVTLTAAAPSGGFVVSLSDNSAAATTPASVTVAQGATSATFTITTTSVSTSTPVTITASAAGVTRTATLTVTAASGSTATLTVTATGRSGERVVSSPAGINVSVGSTGSASFAVGTSITLSVSNGRDAIWSGACSSGGDKRRTCTFTINAAASVSADVR
jgi:hypothetical protein